MYSQEQLDEIVWSLNTRPRKSLGFRSPVEVNNELLLNMNSLKPLTFTVAVGFESSLINPALYSAYLASFVLFHQAIIYFFRKYLILLDPVILGLLWCLHRLKGFAQLKAGSSSLYTYFEALILAGSRSCVLKSYDYPII